MNLPGYDNVLIMHRGEAAFTARRIADNGIYPPSIKDAIQARELAEAAPFWTDENAPHVNTVSQPVKLRAYRQRISRNEWWQAVACAALFAVLIGLTITPDTAVVQAQMEDAQ